MRILGFSDDSCLVTSFEVGHGQHPRHTLFRQGWVPLRPLSARLIDEDVEVSFRVRPVRGRDREPLVRPVHHEEPDSPEIPTVHQRIGAYAVVLSPMGLLGTVNSNLTRAPGTWTLPGGGLDAGEAPDEGVQREVFEETGQRVQLGELLALQSDHWIGRATNGVLEDFHALRIIYAAECGTPSRPVLHDLGGSTERADWVPLESWRHRRWTKAARRVLNQHLERVAGQSCWK